MLRRSLSLVAFGWAATAANSFFHAIPTRFNFIGSQRSLKRSYHRSFVLASITSPDVTDVKKSKKMPVTVLSGFLGAGKV